MKRVLPLVWLWAVGGWPAVLCAAITEPAPLRIPRVSRAPKLADFLTGTPREAEAVVTTFWQFDPHDGEPISQPTTAYLSYDKANLYVGWICKDDPKKIYARVAPRKQIDLDDRVTINIDTFQDHKHAYWFDVNPYGIQYDGRTTDGVGDDPSWEALWYSEGRITENGYVVLETIPFRSIRFPKASKQVWYICLARAIQRNNEWSMWPFISHQKMPQFVGQFAPIEIDEDISPGVNVQMIPYGMFAKDNYLDAAGREHENQHTGGLDAKAVLRDALTLDVALNPDFSEIGTDDPKVQANQRFEVTYPERRPFFLENASIFSMPEQLFFSRRIVNPQFGLKLTGSVGRWGVGALAADDRAPGEVLAQGETGHGDRAMDGVFRTEREFGHQSHAGLFLGGTKFGATSNRVGSVDLRFVTANNWMVSGQATTTQTNAGASGKSAGPGYLFRLKKMDNHVNFQNFYTDRSAGLQSTLGYISRANVRKWETFGSYQWKPPVGRTMMAYGPQVDTSIVYDHEGVLQNWDVEPGFQITLPRLTTLTLMHDVGFELYKEQRFQERLTTLTLLTSWYKWVDLSGSWSIGNQPNYYPATGVTPFLAKANNASVDLTLHPQTHLKLEEIYYYTRLADHGDPAPADQFPAGVI
ncbi:MAG TPA: DUF5916 domain-containing protein, partial [Terracidiphilus sp.]|nr:DUF5916 domain-containing protein [Terracidiphilus sp.]